MKKYILIILLVFSVKVSSAQNYIPIPMDSAAWLVNWGCSHCSNCSIDILTKPLGDTILNSVTYVKFMKYIKNGGCINCSPCDVPLLGYQGAIRQDTLNRKIFIVLPFDSTEKILYDFSQNFGDTLNSILSDICYPEIITGKDSILIGNNYHQRLYTDPTGCNNFGTQFIEGIGSDKGLIESTRWFEIGSNLLCINYNGQTVYPVTTTICDVTVGITEREEIIRANILPNPLNDKFEVNLSKKVSEIEFKLYDIFGRNVLIQKFDNINSFNIERGNLTSGIFFYQLISENRVISTGKIIAE